MLFDEILQVARNVASQRMSVNMPLGYNDTICVAKSCTGRVIVGVSSTQMMNNMPVMFHAELDMINNAMKDNDTAIAEMGLVNGGDLSPMLPCPDCVGRIMGMNPYNGGTLLVLPTQTVPLNQMGAFVQNQGGMPNPNMGQPQPALNPYQNASPYQSAAPYQSVGAQSVMQHSMNFSVSVPVPGQFSSGGEEEDSSLLKNRLNKLFTVDDDLDDEEEKKAEKKKKKFKLF